jgi:hypothetical protein
LWARSPSRSAFPQNVTPGFAFPSVGPLGLASPPSRPGVLRPALGTMPRYDCQMPFSGSFARPPIPCRRSRKETIGSPKFPSCPRRLMPRSQTPVVSCSLALSLPGHCPVRTVQGCCLPPHAQRRLSLAFLASLSFCPRLYTFRGSIARPVSLFPPAPYSRYRVCTWGSLLACWLGFGQVGLDSGTLSACGFFDRLVSPRFQASASISLTLSFQRTSLPFLSPTGQHQQISRVLPPSQCFELILARACVC